MIYLLLHLKKIVNNFQGVFKGEVEIYLALIFVYGGELGYMEAIKSDEIVKYQFYMIPKQLFTDEIYKHLSIDAKLIYALFIDRLELSRKNNWINERGEVFLIFKRIDIAAILNLTDKTVSSAIKELKNVNLIDEERQGLGRPNLIYIGKLKTDNQESTKTDFLNRKNYGSGEEIFSAQTSKISDSVPVKNPIQDTEILPTSNTNINNNNFNKTEKSQSVEEQQLEEIKSRAELDLLVETDEYGNVDSRKKQMVENAIEIMFYSPKLKIGSAILPQAMVRSRLYLINGAKVCYALQKLSTNLGNTSNITNSTNYLISCIYNAITEYHSDAEIQSNLDNVI